MWSRALASKDERIAEIIDTIIKSEPEGLPCIINRNPTMTIIRGFILGIV
jgi:hypothetical protein